MSKTWKWLVLSVQTDKWYALYEYMCKDVWSPILLHRLGDRLYILFVQSAASGAAWVSTVLDTLRHVEDYTIKNVNTEKKSVKY